MYKYNQGILPEVFDNFFGATIAVDKIMERDLHLNPLIQFLKYEQITANLILDISVQKLGIASMSLSKL